MAGDQMKDAKMPTDKIVAEFQQLRNDQRNLVNNLNTLEMDLKEHKTVIETLKDVDQERKCFRLIGGVLCERTVKEVLPQLIQNQGFLEKSIKMVTEQLNQKGVQINKFKEEHNIKIRGEQMPETQASEKSTDENKSENRNILVSK